MQKIKQFIESEKGKDVLVVVIVILMGLGSFELGRLSKENGIAGLKIEYMGTDGPKQANAISSLSPDPAFENGREKNFFASNKGTKYYTLGCSGGKTIKEENKVYFTTTDMAEQAGYSLSTSCR